MRIPLSSFLLGAVSLLPSLALAQLEVRLHQPFVFPSNPSMLDERFLVILDDCGESELRQPVVLTHSAREGWRLDATNAVDDYVCFAVSPGPGAAVRAIRLPPEIMQAGHITVTIGPSGSNRSFSGDVRVYTGAVYLPPSVDGAWYEPGRSGQGLYLQLTRMQYQLGVVALWSTYAKDGSQMWLTGAAPNLSRTPQSVDIPLYVTRDGAFPGAGTTPSSAEPWGTLRLKYLSCHQMSVEWEARDATAYPAGAVQMRQLTPDISHECDIAAFAFSAGRDLVIYDPVIVKEP